MFCLENIASRKYLFYVKLFKQFWKRWNFWHLTFDIKSNRRCLLSSTDYLPPSLPPSPLLSPSFSPLHMIFTNLYKLHHLNLRTGKFQSVQKSRPTYKISHTMIVSCNYLNARKMIIFFIQFSQSAWAAPVWELWSKIFDIKICCVQCAPPPPPPPPPPPFHTGPTLCSELPLP